MSAISFYRHFQSYPNTQQHSSISASHHHRTRPRGIQMSTTIDPSYDRLKELKEFDDAKLGVKGLVDRGLTTIPRIFIHTPDPSIGTKPDSSAREKPSIPVIDFSSPRSVLIDQIRDSAAALGFFQIVNHGVPLESIRKLLNSVQSFNDLPAEEKMRYYRRDMAHGAAFSTNFDLYQSKAASWRDTLQMRLTPPPDWEHVPDVCKDAIVEWDREIVRIGEELMGLLCEGLGLEKSTLKEMSCVDARVLVAHYYPYCPQPELTAGLTSHTDPGVLTVLVQNNVSGLQVKVGDEWVDVEPVEGAIVINIGDILQIMSNDEYKSVEHRVMANPFQDPRVSVAVFFNPKLGENMFGPLSGVTSPEKPARYRQFTFKDYITRFFSKELDGKTLTNCYRV